MPSVEGEQLGCPAVPGRRRDERVVGQAAGDARLRELPKQRNLGRFRQRGDLRTGYEVRLEEGPGIGRGQAVGRGKARQYGIGLDQGMRGDDQSIACGQPSFQRARRDGMMLMPSADGGDHAARIERERRHSSASTLAASKAAARALDSLMGQNGGGGLPGRDEQPSLPDEADPRRLRLDLDHALTPPDLERHTGLEAGLTADLARDHEPPGGVHGRSHGMKFTI